MPLNGMMLRRRPRKSPSRRVLLLQPQIQAAVATRVPEVVSKEQEADVDAVDPNAGLLADVEGWLLVEARLPTEALKERLTNPRTCLPRMLETIRLAMA